MKKKLIALLLTVLFLISMMAGCGSSSSSSDTETEEVTETEEEETEEAEEAEEVEEASEEEETKEVEAEETAEAEEEAATEEAEAAEEDDGLTDEQRELLSLIPEGEALTFQSYPLSEDGETLTLFYSMHPLMSQYYNDASEIPIFDWVEEMTGVHIEFTTVSFTVADTQAQLMIASGDLTDIMPVGQYYTYGADMAIEEDLIVDLTDYLEEYAPNYYGLMQYNDTFANAITTAEGRIAGFSLYSYDNTRLYISGPEIRKDWLDELGLDVPVTIDDYHDVLLAFKTELDVETPMWLHYSGINRDNMLTRAYGIDGIEMIVLDGEVTSSLLQDGFKEYLEMMHEWYEEGLFDSDFYSDTSSEEPELAVVAADTYGLFYQYASEYPELYEYATDPDFEILAITDAVLEEGDVLYVSNGLESEATPEGSYNITTSCDNIGLAIQWMDFFYSPDGWLLSNYGVEGETFEYDEDGTPHWTELISEATTPSLVAKSTYTMLQWPFLMDASREFDGYTDEMIEASDIWASVEADGDYINLPEYISLSADASDIASPIASDIDTYVDECLVKFIIGDMNLEEDYDTFIENLYTIGIQTMLDEYQAAYDEIMALRG